MSFTDAEKLQWYDEVEKRMSNAERALFRIFFDTVQRLKDTGFRHSTISEAFNNALTHKSEEKT